MKAMTKYQLEHFESKIKRHFQPLISEQELLIKQYRTEATNNVVKKLAKKMGADKILQQMKEAEEFMKTAQANAKTFFEKVSKKDKKDLDYSFERDSERLSVSDCEDQLRTWASDLVDREIEKRPEGSKLAQLRQLERKALDTVFESGSPDDLKLALDQVVKHIGLTWAVDTSKIKQLNSY
jgi:hypothetical protein